MEKTLIQSKKTLKERLLQEDDVCVQIAKRIYEDLGKGQIEKPIRQGQARFTNLIRFEVMRAFRNQFDKFDLRFCVYTYYEKKELFNEMNKNWFEPIDHFNYFSHPDIRVVVRDAIEDKSPNEISEAMESVFKANVLVLKSYLGNKDELKLILKRRGLYLVMEDELKWNGKNNI
jgi:hypothetical protein